MMIQRRAKQEILLGLSEAPAVALLGPRQVGKTTLALDIADKTPGSVYLDLENPTHAARLAQPDAYLERFTGQLVILDEVQRMPGLFEVLRGQIDRRRRQGVRTGQFLLLGSASGTLLRQTAESLTGRLVYAELAGFDVLETAADTDRLNGERLWTRGGFPESFLARTDAASARWRLSFVRTYLERDVPQFGVRVPAETLRRFWTMLAHRQGGMFNASRFAASMDVSSPAIKRYVDLLADLLLVRRLPPYFANVGKRLVKAPKVYIRDSGFVHTLLGLATFDAVLSHPVAGPSWEGFAIENLIAAAPFGATAWFYRTQAGAEIDLLVQLPDQRLWAIEIKRSSAPRTSRGFELAANDLGAAKRLLVYPGDEEFPVSEETTAVPLKTAMGWLATMG